MAGVMSQREMSSSTATSSSSLKTANAHSQSTSPAQFQAGPTNTIDGGVQRRTGGSGSFGAGSSSRYNPTARNNQPLRKQQKAQRRAQLADEDAIAESVSYILSCQFASSSLGPLHQLLMTSVGRHEVH